MEILGLKPPATFEEITTAYRDLAKVWHPDRFEDSPRLRKKAEEEFKNVQSAYSALKASRFERHSDRQVPYTQQSSYKQENSYRRENSNKQQSPSDNSTQMSSYPFKSYISENFEDKENGSGSGCGCLVVIVIILIIIAIL
jgi:curved DNA-binding protein CbpA